MRRSSAKATVLTVLTLCLIGPALAVEYSSTDTPKSLIIGNTHSEFTITSDQTILDLNVVINITYALARDLDIRLTAPWGQECYMTYHPYVYASGANMTNTVFDDEAPGSINGGTAPFSASFLPYHNLSRYDGRSMKGTWKMDVHAYRYVGTLNGWSLRFADPPDDDPPVIAITSVSPDALWPPKGRMVPVVVSGTATDVAGTVESAWVELDDQYGECEGTFPITLDGDGNFSVELNLMAARLDTDKEGRTYTISLHAKDDSGNLADPVSVTVTCPHDRGQGNPE